MKSVALQDASTDLTRIPLPFFLPHSGSRSRTPPAVSQVCHQYSPQSQPHAQRKAKPDVFRTYSRYSPLPNEPKTSYFHTHPPQFSKPIDNRVNVNSCHHHLSLENYETLAGLDLRNRVPTSLARVPGPNYRPDFLIIFRKPNIDRPTTNQNEHNGLVRSLCHRTHEHLLLTWQHEIHAILVLLLLTIIQTHHQNHTVRLLRHVNRARHVSVGTFHAIITPTVVQHLSRVTLQRMIDLHGFARRPLVIPKKHVGVVRVGADDS
ncbi:structural maintenance of chromosomes protein [Striga asiatica]|uniref:Structural maintenance of chromosomes protein n=1 Tax=Striga asiatica TaxID=4170 RepID=A0A5A7PSF6_STRAF|nr:structural maintenance of chromosomes protein [Striga asiatica]